MLVWVLVVLVLSLLYLWMKRGLNYWQDRGVPGPAPFVFFGNVRDSFLLRRHIGQIVSEIYRKYEDYPFVGIYRGSTPVLLVRDPKLIKNIFVKDFNSFAKNDMTVNKELDPILARNPFVVDGDEWKSRRSQLSPAFTIGKMKAVFPFVEKVSQRLVEYVESHPNANNKVGLNAKNISTRYTVESVSSCAFGIEGRCFDCEKSEMHELAEKFFSPDFGTSLRMLLTILVPQVHKYLKIRLLRKSVQDKLIEIVRETLKYRKENNVVRNDFIDFMTHVEADTKNLNELDITAHSASFFSDGFETSSTTMMYMLLELARNPNAQDKAREEVNTVLDNKYDGKFCYEAVQEMVYLNACFYESMRTNPVAGFLQKKCTKTYTYKSDGKDFKKLEITLQPEDSIIVPMEIHLDEKYYPDTDKFIPERFMDKERMNNIPMFLFGDGPRICLGQRFALLQVKLAVASLIKNFNITVNPRTVLPYKIIPHYFMYVPKDGIWLNFKKI